jgi:CheY-like chemotaxis protein
LERAGTERSFIAASRSKRRRHSGIREQHQHPPLNLTGVTVLVVEDDEDSRELLRSIVESFGATAVLAADGEEAIRKLSGTNADLILCDLLMPRLDGFGFVNWLRRDPKLSRTHVIAVTALGTDADFKRTWDAGFNGHLVKPIDYDTVASQLERIFWAHRG